MSKAGHLMATLIAGRMLIPVMSPPPSQKRRRGRQPIDPLKKMVTCTIAVPEEMMAKVEALLFQAFPQQGRAAVLRYLIGKGLEAHAANENAQG